MLPLNGRERENIMGPGIFTKYAKQVIIGCVVLLIVIAVMAAVLN